MKKEELKQILHDFYSISGVNLILRGERRPSYEIMYKLNKKHGIPFTAWLNIKSYLNSTSTNTQTSNTKGEQKVS